MFTGTDLKFKHGQRAFSATSNLALPIKPLVKICQRTTPGASPPTIKVDSVREEIVTLTIMRDTTKAAWVRKSRQHKERFLIDGEDNVKQDDQQSRQRDHLSAENNKVQ